MIVRRSSAARRPGITLLEVLVALAIFIMALAALGQLVQLGMEQADEADKETVAMRLAQSKLAEFEAGAIPIDGGSGEFIDQETVSETDKTPLWKWEVVSTQDDFIDGLYDVTVTVTRLSPGNPNNPNAFSVTLSQMVFDPALMGTAAPTPAPTPPATTGSRP